MNKQLGLISEIDDDETLRIKQRAAGALQYYTDHAV
jgi:hypothetical protein